VDCLEQIQLAQNMVVNHELANWRQSQRMFNWEDDRGKVELNTIQQWFEALAELVWRNRLLAKQVSTQPNYKRMDRQEFDLIS